MVNIRFGGFASMKKLHVRCKSWTVFRVFFRNLIFEANKSRRLQSYAQLCIGLVIVRALKKVPISKRGGFRLLALASIKENVRRIRQGLRLAGTRQSHKCSAFQGRALERAVSSLQSPVSSLQSPVSSLQPN